MNKTIPNYNKGLYDNEIPQLLFGGVKRRNEKGKGFSPLSSRPSLSSDSFNDKHNAMIKEWEQVIRECDDEIRQDLEQHY